MRYFLEMGEAEMAESLDVARGTVRQLHRALDRLQAALLGQAHSRADGWPMMDCFRSPA